MGPVLTSLGNLLLGDASEEQEEDLEMGFSGNPREAVVVSDMGITSCERVSGIGNLTFLREGVRYVPEGLVQDSSQIIQVLGPFPYRHPHSAAGINAVPECRLVQMIDPVTRQRSLHFEFSYPKLDIEPCKLVIHGREVWNYSIGPEVVYYPPVLSEDCNYMLVTAPLYLGLEIKFTNVEIAGKDSVWSADSRKFWVDVYLKGPTNAARRQPMYDCPFQKFYQAPPP